jgi:hypothetical protein
MATPGSVNVIDIDEYKLGCAIAARHGLDLDAGSEISEAEEVEEILEEEEEEVEGLAALRAMNAGTYLLRYLRYFAMGPVCTPRAAGVLGATVPLTVSLTQRDSRFFHVDINGVHMVGARARGDNTKPPPRYRLCARDELWDPPGVWGSDDLGDDEGDGLDRAAGSDDHEPVELLSESVSGVRGWAGAGEVFVRRRRSRSPAPRPTTAPQSELRSRRGGSCGSGAPSPAGLGHVGDARVKALRDLDAAAVKPPGGWPRAMWTKSGSARFVTTAPGMLQLCREFNLGGCGGISSPCPLGLIHRCDCAVEDAPGSKLRACGARHRRVDKHYF